MSALLPLDTWVPILDGDESGAAMYLRHYSSLKTRQKRIDNGTLLFLGPGEKLVLATPCRHALFAWRYARLRADEQHGIECAIFRNEGAGVASELVKAADLVADRRWPGLRHFTFINERLVRGNPPGNRFRRAGWRECGRTKVNDLLILERVAPAASRLAA